MPFLISTNCSFKQERAEGPINEQSASFLSIRMLTLPESPALHKLSPQDKSFIPLDTVFSPVNGKRDQSYPTSQNWSIKYENDVCCQASLEDRPPPQSCLSPTTPSSFLELETNLPNQQELEITKTELIPSWVYIYISPIESACNAGEPGSIPGSGRSPGEGNGNPLQYSCLENPMDRGAWRATVCGVAGTDTTEQLPLSLSFTFSFCFEPEWPWLCLSFWVPTSV